LPREKKLTADNDPSGLLVITTFYTQENNMEVKLTQKDNAFLMVGQNDSGNLVLTDGSADIGGGNIGMRPMQLMLVSIGSCSAIDVIYLLRKQRQPLRDIEVKVTGDRVPNPRGASPFTGIHMHFDLYGDLNEKKVARAVELSLTTLCSAVKTVEKTAPVTADFTIHP
jgi:putative redox protein